MMLPSPALSRADRSFSLQAILLKGVRFNLSKRNMVLIIEHKQDISSSFEGTIIDVETIGDFFNQYYPRKSP